MEFAAKVLRILYQYKNVYAEIKIFMHEYIQDWLTGYVEWVILHTGGVNQTTEVDLFPNSEQEGLVDGVKVDFILTQHLALWSRFLNLD